MNRGRVAGLGLALAAKPYPKLTIRFTSVGKFPSPRILIPAKWLLSRIGVREPHGQSPCHGPGESEKVVRYFARGCMKDRFTYAIPLHALLSHPSSPRQTRLESGRMGNITLTVGSPKCQDCAKGSQASFAIFPGVSPQFQGVIPG